MSTTFSSREFNQDTGRAKKAAEQKPVFITDRSRLVHVPLSIDDYQKLTRTEPTIVELLSMPEAADVELELPKREISRMRIPDFS